MLLLLKSNVKRKERKVYLGLFKGLFEHSSNKFYWRTFWLFKGDKLRPAPDCFLLGHCITHLKPNSHFSREDIEMASGYMEKCSTSPNIRETSTRKTCHLTPVRMAIIKKLRNIKCWWEWGEKQNLHRLLVEIQTGVAAKENSIEVFPKVKNRTTIWSSNPTAGYLPKENKNTNSKRYMHTILIAAVLMIARIWKQLTCPSVNGRIKKMWYTHYVQWNSIPP